MSLNNNAKPTLRNPSLVEKPAFQRWIQTNCKSPSSGFLVNDVDIFIRRRCRKREIEYISFWEVKCKSASIPQQQRLMISIIKQAFQEYFKNNDTMTYELDSGFTYEQKIFFCGFHTLIMDGICPDSSERIWMNGKLVTKERILEALNLDIHFRDIESI